MIFFFRFSIPKDFISRLFKPTCSLIEYDPSISETALIFLSGTVNTRFGMGSPVILFFTYPERVYDFCLANLLSFPILIVSIPVFFV